MRRRFIVVALLTGLAATAGAQFHNTGWTFTAMGGAALPIALGTVDASGGSLKTLVSRVVLPRRTWFTAGEMDIDNNTYVIGGFSEVMSPSMYRIDGSGNILQTTQVLNTIPRHPGLTDILVDQDGHYIALTTHMLKVDRNSLAVTTLLGTTLYSPRSFTVDIDTGDFIAVDVHAASVASRVLRISADGRTVGVVATMPALPTSKIEQLVRSGNFYFGAFKSGSNPVALLKVTGNGQVTTVLAANTSLSDVTGVFADRSSAPSPRLVLASGGIPTGLFALDVATTTVTTFWSTGQPTVNLGNMDGFATRGRNLSTEWKPLTKSWDILVSVPRDAGFGYVVGLTLSGTRPGFGLPDGRHVNLNLDNLTMLSVSGRLGNAFTGQSGFLDAQGASRARLRVPPLVGSGVRLWIQAVTLRGGTLLTVPDPIGLTL